MKNLYFLALLTSSFMMISCGGNKSGENSVKESEEKHEWVDLGLPSGTKWATMNLGATSSTDYGDYFAWGEVSTKDFYYENNYTFPLSGFEYELSPEQDAAVAYWGDNWRMPTKEQFEELLNNCDCNYDEIDGVRVFVAVGPNGNIVILPLGGWKKGHNPIDEGSEGLYYTCTRSFEEGAFASNGPFAFKASIGETNYYDNGNGGYHLEPIGYHYEKVAEAGSPICGYNIRPVLFDEKAHIISLTENTIEYISLIKNYLNAYNNSDVHSGYEILKSLNNVTNSFSGNDHKALFYWKRNEGANLWKDYEAIDDSCEFNLKIKDYAEEIIREIEFENSEIFYNGMTGEHSAQWLERTIHNGEEGRWCYLGFREYWDNIPNIKIRHNPNFINDVNSIKVIGTETNIKIDIDTVKDLKGLIREFSKYYRTIEKDIHRIVIGGPEDEVLGIEDIEIDNNCAVFHIKWWHN